MVKGSVRRKVRFLSSLDKIFGKPTLVEESFNKNQFLVLSLFQKTLLHWDL